MQKSNTKYKEYLFDDTGQLNLKVKYQIIHEIYMYISTYRPLLYSIAICLGYTVSYIA